jgi:hypothetical protein
MGQVDGAPGVEGSVDVLGERHEASLYTEVEKIRVTFQKLSSCSVEEASLIKFNAHISTSK